MINTIKKVIDGGYDDKVVWVCSYFYQHYQTSKPTRHIPPTEVTVRNNAKGRWNKPLRQLMKYNLNGQEAKTPVAKLMHRPETYIHESFNIFEDKAECLAEYKKISDKAIKGYEDFIKSERIKLDKIKVKIAKALKG